MSIYVWGTQGEGADVISAEWIRDMENSKLNANRVIEKWEANKALGYGDVMRAFDCSGLGVCFLLAHNLV